jgi:hypothetical protein
MGKVREGRREGLREEGVVRSLLDARPTIHVAPQPGLAVSPPTPRRVDSNWSFPAQVAVLVFVRTAEARGTATSFTVRSAGKLRETLAKNLLAVVSLLIKYVTCILLSKRT